MQLVCTRKCRVIVRSRRAADLLDVVHVEPGYPALWFRDGVHQETLGPGTYAFWKGAGKLRIEDVGGKANLTVVLGEEGLTSRVVKLL